MVETKDFTKFHGESNMPMTTNKALTTNIVKRTRQNRQREIDQWLRPKQRVLAIDIEAIGLRPKGGTIWMLSVTEGKKTTVYHDCNGLRKQSLPAKLLKDLADPNVLKIIHNAGYDIPYIKLVWGVDVVNVWDTMLAEIVIQGFIPDEQHKYLKPEYGAALEFVLPRYGFKTPDKTTRENFINRQIGIPFTKKEVKYAEDDTKNLEAIMRLQMKEIERLDLVAVAKLEMETVRKVVEMRVRGIGFDSDLWREIALINEAEFKRRLSKLPESVGNWNSEKQVKKYFKEQQGIEIDTFKNLYKIYLANPNKMLAKYLYARELHKSVTSYGMNFFGSEKLNFTDSFVDSDGRIRCGMVQIINSGRFAMNNPNLQQLPGKDIKNQQRQIAMKRIYAQLGERSVPQHRRAFVARPGHSFIIGDFGGQEMGIMAAAALEQAWIDTLLAGNDIHAFTASMLYAGQWENAGEKGCTFPKKCTCPGHQALREPTKILNFMLAYGGGYKKFASDTGMPEFMAKGLVYRYRQVIKATTAWLEKNGADAEATGLSYSADPFRRRRVLKGEESWELINQGKNNPVQSAGANMLKLAMINIPDKYPMCLVIHDEIILEVPDRMTKEASKVLKKVMEDAATYITGIKGLVQVEPRVAKNLYKEDKTRGPIKPKKKNEIKPIQPSRRNKTRIR